MTTERECTCGADERTSDGRLKYPVMAARGHATDCPEFRRVKRTHGPCTCPRPPGTGTYFEGHHLADCPSLYPAQREPDALTRIARLARDLAEDDCQAILVRASGSRWAG